MVIEGSANQSRLHSLAAGVVASLAIAFPLLLVLAWSLPFAKGANAGPLAYLAALMCAVCQLLLGLWLAFPRSSRPRWPLKIGIVCVVLWIANLYPIKAHFLSGSNRVPCASNLRQIGQAIMLYARDHDRAYPPTLDLLVTDLHPSCFVCPYSNDRAATGPTTKAIAAKITGQGYCSYLYFGAGLTMSSPSDIIVACDHPDNHKDAGINVLFADGHVEWFPADPELLRALGSTTRPIPWPVR